MEQGTCHGRFHMPAFGALPTVSLLVTFAVMGMSTFAAYKTSFPLQFRKISKRIHIVFELLLKLKYRHAFILLLHTIFFKDNQALGHSIGKLVNLSLGIGKSFDTHFELIVGKIPEYKESNNHCQVDYYRGTYYLVNLHELKMEFFKPQCYESDLEHAISNKLDCFRIVEWLNNIKSLFKF
jgi:hypothetical protein